MRQNAMLMALSDKAANNHLTILDKLEVAEYKTKAFNRIIAGLEKNIFMALKPETATPKTNGKTKEAKAVAGKAKAKLPAAKRSFLIMVEKADEKLSNSARNLPGLELLNLDNMNILDLLKYKNLIITKAAVEKLQARYK